MQVKLKAWCKVLILSLLLIIVTPLIAQDTEEEQIEQLEATVDSLQDFVANVMLILPGYETIVDTPNVQYGITGIVDRTLDKGYFYVNHSDYWKMPYWVAYYLTPSCFDGDVKSKDFKFRKYDKEIPPGKRSTDDDYKYSDRNRGHMAPAADFKSSKEAMKSTFILSNASPQYPDFNNGIWKRLEEQIRDMVSEKGQAWIIVGNLFLDIDSLIIQPQSWIGHTDELNVPVPTHLFKTILTEDENEEVYMYAFLIPNERQRINDPTEDYRISINHLEEITGYDFYPLLLDSIEEYLESDISRIWAW